MFSRVQTSDGSGHQKAKSRGLGHLLRCWVWPFIQHLWPFSLMEAKVTQASLWQETFLVPLVPDEVCVPEKTLRNILHGHFSLQCVVMGC